MTRGSRAKILHDDVLAMPPQETVAMGTPTWAT
jgi:hypothetical protein